MSRNIELRGVRVHNLKAIDVDAPLNRLTLITGVSGSGKSSLAFDTLYAEGQRRYIESFSSADRRHLERLEKPDADSIVRIPPAIALRQNAVARISTGRSTIATVTEIDDLLRILFAGTGTVVCPDCDVTVNPDSPGTIAAWIRRLPSDTKLQIGFPLASEEEDGLSDVIGDQDGNSDLLPLLESGFTRAVVFETTDVAPGSDGCQTDTAGYTISVQELVNSPADGTGDAQRQVTIVVDRIIAGKTRDERVLEAIETSLRESNGRCTVMTSSRPDDPSATRPVHSAEIDGKAWHLVRFSSGFECPGCGRTFSKPEPASLSFRSPLGACGKCRGTGRTRTFSLPQLVPDESLSLRAGAVVALRGDRWKRERERLIRFAEKVGIPVDVAFRELSSEHERQLISGRTAPHDSDSRSSEGLSGLFDRLEKRTQHAAVREFLSQWSQISTCQACCGTRLNPDALTVRLGRLTASDETSSLASIGDVAALSVDDTLNFLETATSELPVDRRVAGENIITDLVARLSFLKSVGLGYLCLNRDMASLSRGEAQRVALTSIAGSNLVNTLFVIDEPSAGLHARDVARVLELIRNLRDGGNTVVVVEHEPAFLEAADHVLDIGPGAGQQGGTLVYAGSPDGLTDIEESATGRWLADTLRMSVDKGAQDSGPSAGAVVPTENATNRRAPTDGACKHQTASGWLKLRGATSHSVQDCSVDIPLGKLCVVTGVSGAGKSSLIEKVLYPAVCQKLGIACSIDDVGEYAELTGVDQLSAVELIDDRALAGSRRSNPATWLKVFDEIRKLFADTEDARRRNLTASHFSFNTDSGGRCGKCDGTGRVQIDMQFLADVSMTCPECHGTRYLPHILEVQWRARTIADVLAMTASEAFSFFRGKPKIQKRLRSLKEVGLDYLTLGQPLSTLSGGESQRLKLASCLSTSKRNGSLLIMNEPTTGLHPVDVARLLECFDGLLSVGHSLVVIEHHLDVIRHADHIIDIGPEAGPGGGQIVASGSVAEIADCPESLTGQILRRGSSSES